jgi:hypothetical protein
MVVGLGDLENWSRFWGSGALAQKVPLKADFMCKACKAPYTERECKDLGPVCVVSAYALETFCAWGPF